LSRWTSFAVLVSAVASVLVLGAATHGFAPTLAHVSGAESTQVTPTKPVPPPRGPELRASVERLIVDAADNAVVVRLTNPNRHRAIVDAPIAIALLDSAGTVVGTNGAAGTDPLFIHVPYLGPGETALFVSDQIATDARPSRARVTARARFSGVRRARLALRATQLRMGPFGWIAAGSVVNSGRVDRSRRVLLQAVVHRAGRIVAAGTTIVVTPPRRSTPFQILLLGNATGGRLSVWAPPQ
jgi:hypothetical protein